MNTKTVLVFPCGSEIGLEIYRALRYSRHVRLIGGNSVSDHGRFVYEDYIGDIPFVSEQSFVPYVSVLVNKRGIDAIYPAMDSVINTLAENRDSVGCEIISSPFETAYICGSKQKTYNRLKDVVPTPRIYGSIEAINVYPVFMKPDIGYG